MPMRVLFITLEFSAATFSGNGVCAQSQVRALTQLGHEVFVISGRPADLSDPPKPQGATIFHEVPLSTWGRLDRQSPWQEFAAACTRLGAKVADFRPQVVWGVDWTSLHPYYEVAGRLHPPEELDAGALPYIFMNYRVFCRSVKRASETDEEREFLRQKEAESVSAAALVAALGKSDADYIFHHLMGSGQGNKPRPRVILPALRSDLADLPLPSDIDHWLTSTPKAEQNDSMHSAFAELGLRPSLTHPDAGSSQQLGATSQQLGQPSDRAGPDATPAASASRNENPDSERSSSGNDKARGMSGESAPAQEQKALTDNGDQGIKATALHSVLADCRLFGGAATRRFLTCCVRLSPEKEPLRFVDVVENLVQAGTLSRLQITPVLCGSATSPFANTVRQRLKSVWPDSLILSQFLGPQQLAELYSATRLNFHPCQYDAYGMTIVEAASQGAPTLLDQAKDVGATDLLLPESDEVLTADFGLPKQELAELVGEVLADESRLMRVGALAARKARMWTELALGYALTELIEAAVSEEKL